ncbi:phosphoenolpyruvate carboxylase [Picrophilus oshimae]|uniref:phosphoenolpyruvate carboxylase n=1 Tax=Picrophilus oshimae TaxID=46632 RepID=UPI00064FC17B
MAMIPKTMSTQHPDNAKMPAWASEKSMIRNDDEVEEAYQCYTIGIKEVMWDAEGKDVDTHVLRKLISKNHEFFEKNVLGSDIFLTYRVPNPAIEGTERKVLTETLESIPVNYDVFNTVYKRDIPPIFEVILPFTTSSKDLLNIAKYYEKAVAARDEIELYDNVMVKNILGETKPKKINIIPLIEDKDSMFNIDGIVKNFARAVSAKKMRVFIARSDPAMNYGMIPAVLMSKYAASRLCKMNDDIENYPIVGVGSSTFRGRFSPENIEKSLYEYSNYYTFTLQSAFKYDYPQDSVKNSINIINRHERSFDYLEDYEEEIIKNAVNKYVINYQKIIEKLAPAINNITMYLPKRRSRKLHIGLFGYSRSTGNVTLPRAISFVGAMYSMGLPPEIIGISSLLNMKDDELDIIEKTYINLRSDIMESSSYLNYEVFDALKDVYKIDQETINMIKADVKYIENNYGIKSDLGYERERHNYLSSLMNLAFKNHDFENTRKYILDMALIRKFIG